MNVLPLTSGPIAADTGTIDLAGKLFGGFDLNCDGTNVGTLIVRQDDQNGRLLVYSRSVVGKIAFVPMLCSGRIYYSISGTNADAMLYEWTE